MTIPKEKSVMVLASYATYKELYSKEQYKSQYQILAEFIKYVLNTNTLYIVTVEQVQKLLNEVFGFDLPWTVIKSSMKKIDAVQKKQNGEYSVDLRLLKVNEQFESSIEQAEQDGVTVTQKLISYSKKNNLGLEIREDQLREEFIQYLVDDMYDGKYENLISKFIIENADDCRIQDQIKNVREGCILYTGLMYNIGNKGSIRKHLTLYLDTEVLFYIAGYNGTLFQEIGLDLMKLVSSVNEKKKLIHLKYFSDVKKEIELFFDQAEDIVKGKKILKDNMAMKTIVNGCKDSTDIATKKADFFTDLQYQYGITLDDQDDYYDADNFELNLEGIEVENEKEDKSQDNYDSLKCISHINKLRKGKHFREYTEAEYILVTETNRTLNLSRKVTEILQKDDTHRDGKRCGFALNLSGITNILWFKLNNGFGKQVYPKNLNSMLKARVVLAKYISRKVLKTYDDVLNQFREGVLTEEQVAQRILVLREKATLPEDLTADNIDDSLNFDEEYLKTYERTHRLLEEEHEKQQAVIDQVRRENAELTANYQQEVDKYREAAEKDAQIQKQQQQELEEKANIIAQYQKRDELVRKSKEKRKKRICFFMRSILKLVLEIVCIYVFYRVCRYCIPNVASYTSAAFTIISFVAMVRKGILDDYKKNFESENDKNQEKVRK